MVKQDLHQQARDNSAWNASAYQQWINTHTPDNIRLANMARASLARTLKTKRVPTRMKPLHDARRVPGRRLAYIWFVMERYGTDDFLGKTMTEAGRILGAEYKALSPAERKVCSPCCEPLRTG